MRVPPFFARSPYLWMRELHLYTGLFLSPFVLLFAITGIFFNHAWNPWGKKETGEVRTAQVEVAADQDGIAQAKAVMRQVGVSGEIRNVFRRANRLTIPVMMPGKEAEIVVDMEAQTAQIRTWEMGFGDALLYLHKSPGPHNAAIRGNWVYTRLWEMLSDGVVYLVLFLSASGIYVWTVLKATRHTGLIAMGAGVLSFVLLAYIVW